MSSNDIEKEASIGATIAENSEASSHDAVSTSGLEEHETVDPLPPDADADAVPNIQAAPPDALGFHSGPNFDFDTDQDNYPFDETELSEGSYQSVSEARNQQVAGAVDEETKSTTNEETPEVQHIIHAEESPKNSAQVAAADAGDKDGQHGPEEGLMMEGVPEGTYTQEALVTSIIETVRSYFQNATSQQVWEIAETIVEHIQTYFLGRSNESIWEIGLEGFIEMTRLTLTSNFILPPPDPPNVNDNAFCADSVSETREVQFTEPTQQAQSNASENSDNKPKRKGQRYKCKYCPALKKGHVCNALRHFDAWTNMGEPSLIPAEIEKSARLEEQKRDRELEVSPEEWTPCVPNQDLSSDLEPQEERTVAPSAKTQREMVIERQKKKTASAKTQRQMEEIERQKKKRKTADVSPPSEGQPREEQEKQEIDVEQSQRNTEDYADDVIAAASTIDTTTTTEAFRAAHVTGETDAPLPGNETDTQQQPEPPSQDAILEDSNDESAPNQDDESSSDSDTDIELYEV